ncbi:MAG: AsnC family transcriptional regulator, partial [Hyphomicrobiales bacterium]
GRLSNVELAEKVGLSSTPCLRRVRRLEQSGLIGGYRAVLDRKQAGFGITVFVSVKIDGHRAENAADAETIFQDIEEIISCHVISGEADFLLQIAVPDLAAYEDFVFKKLIVLPVVKDVHSNFVIRTVKDHAPLPLSHLTR